MAPVSGMLLHSALRRRSTFPSREAAVHSFGSRAWKNWDKAVLRSYVSHGFRETAGMSAIPRAQEDIM